MILPVVRERLERLLLLAPSRRASARCVWRSEIQFSGLSHTRKALLAAYLAGELRRPAFSRRVNKQPNRLRTLRFSHRFFHATSLFSAFDTLPWDARSPHADFETPRRHSFSASPRPSVS